jgi:CDP-glycerol glycerophosphotransferase (TagB/SpsB family)
MQLGWKKIKKALNKYIWLYISMLSPRNKNTMIFGAWFGEKYDDNPRYLFEYVVKERPDIHAVWITANKEIYSRLKKEHLPVCMSNSKEAKRLALKSKYVCTATGRIDIGEENVKYLGNAYYINLWHGIPLKKIMHDDEYSQQDSSIKSSIRSMVEKIPLRHYYVVSTSDIITKIYTSAFQQNKKHILQLGQPRNDYFYIDHENPYKKRFPGKKIILYMPTHRNEGKTMIDVTSIFDIECLNQICEKNNAVFLIKKHFYHLGEQEIDKKYNNVLDITNEVTESQCLLDAADILITDYSSCYIDYLLLDRPIIFYNYDLEKYQKEDRKMYFDYEKVTPGRKCRDFGDFREELELILDGTDTYENDRKHVCNMFYSEDNQKEVSEKIVERLQAM